MNHKPQYMVYLAGPIDGISPPEAASWRTSLALDFPDVLFFLPNRAYANVTRESAGVMDGMNRHAIEHCTGVVANLSGKGRGFGTIREIEYACSKNKFVAVVVDPEDIGENTLLTYDLMLSKTPTEAMEALLTVWADRMANATQLPQFLGFLGPPPAEE